jgi:hypothetical protein
MFKTLTVRLAAGTVALAVVTGCSNPAGPDDLVVDPVQIENVEVRVLESSPPQAVAHVEGVLGDGCSEVHSVEQARSGNVVELTILRQRPRDAICTMILRAYIADSPLRGTFPPGRYVLRVNGVESEFRTE